MCIYPAVLGQAQSEIPNQRKFTLPFYVFHLKDQISKPHIDERAIIDYPKVC
jgi:hypothetical protein